MKNPRSEIYLLLGLKDIRKIMCSARIYRNRLPKYFIKFGYALGTGLTEEEKKRKGEYRYEISLEEMDFDTGRVVIRVSDYRKERKMFYIFK